MLVRLIMEEDIEDVVALSAMNSQLSTPYLAFNPDKVRETCRRSIAVASPTIFVVEDKRRVVGFLLASINGYYHADGLYVASEVIFVDPAYHGSRAAILLVKELIRWAELLNAEEIASGNDNLIKTDRTTKFFEHFGFEQVGSFMRRMTHNG